MQQYLFLMLGFLGSGKSYVSKWLAPHTGSVLFRVDPLRWQMFGEDRPELYIPENKALVNNATQYAVGQVLESGLANAITDANHNQRSVRDRVRGIAKKHNALGIMVWVQTPLEIAKERTIEREKTEGHKLMEEGLVEKMANLLEEPDDDELVIHIDGLATAEEQKRQFDEQFARIKQNTIQ